MKLIKKNFHSSRRRHEISMPCPVDDSSIRYLSTISDRSRLEHYCVGTNQIVYHKNETWRTLQQTYKFEPIRNNGFRGTREKSFSRKIILHSNRQHLRKTTRNFNKHCRSNRRTGYRLQIIHQPSDWELVGHPLRLHNNETMS